MSERFFCKQERFLTVGLFEHIIHEEEGNIIDLV